MINIWLARVPINITYQEALTLVPDQVNSKNLPEVSSSNNGTRIVSELGYARGGCGSVGQRHARGWGCGRAIGHGREGKSVDKSRINYSIMIQCVNGTQMGIHPAYQFTDAEWKILPYSERKKSYNNFHSINVVGRSEILSDIPLSAKWPRQQKMIYGP